MALSRKKSTPIPVPCQKKPEYSSTGYYSLGGPNLMFAVGRPPGKYEQYTGPSLLSRLKTEKQMEEQINRLKESLTVNAEAGLSIKL